MWDDSGPDRRVPRPAPANEVCHPGYRARSAQKPVGEASRQGQESPLLTKVEAAAFCRISIRSFERLVQPHTRTVALGSRVLFFEEDIRQWLEQLRDGSSSAIPARRYSSSGSRTLAVGSTSPRATEILAQLRAKRAGSTPT